MTAPQMPGVPGVPQPQAQLGQWPGMGTIPAPGGGGISVEQESWNWQQWREEAGTQLQPLPIAEYDMEVSASEAAKSSNGKIMFKITWRVITGPYAGRVAWGNITVSPENPNALAIFFRQMDALGLNEAYFNTNPSPDQIATDLVHRQARIKLTHREYPKNSGVIRNNVETINPPASQMMGMPMGQQGFPPPQTGAYQAPMAAPPPPQQYAQAPGAQQDQQPPQPAPQPVPQPASQAPLPAPPPAAAPPMPDLTQGQPQQWPPQTAPAAPAPQATQPAPQAPPTPSVGNGEIGTPVITDEMQQQIIQAYLASQQGQQPQATSPQQAPPQQAQPAPAPQLAQEPGQPTPQGERPAPPVPQIF